MKEENNVKKRGRRAAGMPTGREALLPVALGHFARHGYEATSLRKIATDAGVDMALTARVFGSKSALWEAVLEYLSIKQVKHLEALGAIEKEFVNKPLPALRKFICELVTISVDIPEFPSLLMSEATAAEERFDMLLQQLVGPFRQACLPLVEQAISRGYMRGNDPHMIFALLISSISVLVITPQIAVPAESITRPDIIENLISELSGLLIIEPDD